MTIITSSNRYENQLISFHRFLKANSLKITKNILEAYCKQNYLRYSVLDRREGKNVLSTFYGVYNIREVVSDSFQADKY